MTAAKKVLDKITSYSSVVIFIAMVLMVTYQVIARYFFKSPSSVTEVLTRYCFVWLIIISATYMFESSPNLCVNSSSSYISPSMLPLSSGDLIEWSLVCHSTLSYQRFCD